MLFKQISKDIKQEWTWAFFYTVVSTVTVMAVLFLSISFSAVRKQSSAINTFVKKNVYMFQTREIQMEPNRSQPAEIQQSRSSIMGISDYLEKCFLGEGKAGSYIFVGNDGYVDRKYDQILILFGQYCNLTGLSCDGPINCYVPEKYSVDVGKTVQISGKEVPVSGDYDNGFELYHPLYFIDAESPLLSNTIILCTNNLEAVDALFPWWDLRSGVFDRMIMVNPTMDEVKELQDIFYKEKAAIYTGISTEDFARTSSIATIRAHRLSLWFNVLSGFLLIVLLLCNVIRMIEAHISDYTVHHLYGATIRHIRLRVEGFVFVLHIPPLVGIMFILLRNNMTLWFFLPLGIAFILCLCLFVANYTSKRIGTLDSLQNLRRDY